MSKYYSTDLTLSIVEIKAESRQQADEIIGEFLDKISEVMSDKVRWEEADWYVDENTLNEELGEWVVS